MQDKIMPNFYILRVQREDNPADKGECQVKFFPILSSFARLPIIVVADDELTAMKNAVSRFPFFRCSLAVQECVNYDRIVAGLVKTRLAKRVLGTTPNKNPGTSEPGTIRSSEPVGDSRIPENRDGGSGENQTEAELAF
jgi:hypothetical protein